MKKVLISMKVTQNPNYYEVNNILDFEYVRFFEKLGFMPIFVPNNSEKVSDFFKLDDIGLVVLTGGNNVDPKLYGGEELSDVFPERDKTEGLLATGAFERNIPLMGICRGFQYINVLLGGKITHGIDNHVRKDHKLSSSSEILDGVVTNTYHNQGIVKSDLSNKLEILATSPDGFIEAFLGKENKILGVQWHPERQEKDFDIDLVVNFLGDKI